MVLQKNAFLASESSVELSIHFNKKLGSGFFGGEGFIMQHLSGSGTAFVEVDGELVEYTLAPASQMVVDTGNVLGFDLGVSIDIQSVPGLKNKLLGWGGAVQYRAHRAGPHLASDYAPAQCSRRAHSFHPHRKRVIPQSFSPCRNHIPTPTEGPRRRLPAGDLFMLRPASRPAPGPHRPEGWARRIRCGPRPWPGPPPGRWAAWPAPGYPAGPARASMLLWPKMACSLPQSGQR